jgi:acetyl-CoA C-acetyltransferase
VRLAFGDAGLPGPVDADLVAVVSLLSARHRDPAALVADAVSITTRRTALTTPGGNSPQSLLNEVAGRIGRGELDLAVLTGAEAARTAAKARKLGVALDWPTADRDPDEQIGEEVPLVGEPERARGVMQPIELYPMIETARRGAAGRDVHEHQRRLGELWSRFSAVAAANPYAAVPVFRSSEEIITPTAVNRIVGWPYTKYMVSNNDVDQAAAVIICSAGRAGELGVPRDRWVFVHAGVDGHETYSVLHRAHLGQAPALRAVTDRTVQLGGVGVDDIALFDLYSCFPVAVQAGADALGLALDRPLTVTGGLPFAGGPWNNYVMHAIATMVTCLREAPGERGLVWANGGYLTKFATGIYSTEPPTDSFRWESAQDEIDTFATRAYAEPLDAVGPAVIEGYTVMHNRAGAPERAIVAALLGDGRRALAISDRSDLMAAMVTGEWVGTTVHLDDGGTFRF